MKLFYDYEYYTLYVDVNGSFLMCFLIFKAYAQGKDSIIVALDHYWISDSNLFGKDENTYVTRGKTILGTIFYAFIHSTRFTIGCLI